MKLVKVSDDFFIECKKHNVHKELLYNENGRPSVLLVKLKYKGKYHKFIVPLRSNISSRTPKEQFLSLPPNKNTKSNHSHGVHYIKLFPIVDEYVQTYLISDSFDLMVKNILDNNEKIIIDACQNYLKKCENGQKHFMTPDIDEIINMFDTIKGQSNNSNTKETS